MGNLPGKPALSRISLLSDLSDSLSGQEQKCTSGCNAVCAASIAKMCSARLSSHKSHIPGFVIALVAMRCEGDDETLTRGGMSICNFYRCGSVCVDVRLM